MYVGGQRAVLGADPGLQPFTYSYFDQPDWIHPIDPAARPALRRSASRADFLRLFEQEVSAVEDPDLKDVALGGADTTQRLRLLRQVRRETVQAPDCTTAWDEALALWRARDGLLIDPRTLRLWSETRLLVGFSGSGSTPDPCDPIARNGYLGAREIKRSACRSATPA